jgi:uncharacterized protein (TIGR02246 family)
VDSEELELRKMYDGLLAAWASNSAEDYAAFFTADAQYIIASGAIENGRSEIEAGHREIFEAWAKGTMLAGEILSIRSLAPDVRLITATGSVRVGEKVADDEVTIYTFVAIRADGGWKFAAYQNTPVASYG